MNEYNKNLNTKKQTLNIYICFTPVHLFLAPYLRDGNFDPQNCHVLVDVLGSERYDKNDGWDMVLYKQVNSLIRNSRTLKTHILKIINAKRLYRILKDEMIKYPHVVIWYAHLGDYLCNHLFFRHKYAPWVDFNVFQDGTLNYWNYKQFYDEPKIYILKFILGLLIGFPFFPLTGLSSGVDRAEVKGQYLLGGAHLSVHPEKFRPISIPVEQNPESRGQDVVILGQESHLLHMDMAFFEAETDRMMDFAAQLVGSPAKIFYKQHHYDPTGGYFLEKAKKKGFLLIEDMISAELLIAKLPVGHVVALTSSALFNLKLMFPKGLQAWAVGFEKILEAVGVKDSENSRLKELYASAGVNFV